MQQPGLPRVCCRRPYTVPPSALQTEMSKPLYLYFGLNLAPTKSASARRNGCRSEAGHGLVMASQRISADQFSETVTFSFTVGNDAYHWAWTMCPKDTEAEDGIGLPGHHGCGDQRVLYSARLPWLARARSGARSACPGRVGGHE